ncbi:hypothetical protein C1H46_018789 [Malus baccata]|uniref:Uncharacterized protein n=1 Tax=Malus baccata TaxID=106549 RepID=A0A540MA98_MALBA|nr:hypothetical protein C1H46_018789 [Malus baccata]
MTSPDDSDGGWVNLAMNDEAAVVDLLLRLKHSAPPPPSKRSSIHGFPTLRWCVRQRRSRNVPRRHHADDVDAEDRKSKKGESSGARASPTTPLSWSGATSAGGVDGSEESSKLLKPTDAARSKRTRGRFDVFSLVFSAPVTLVPLETPKYPSMSGIFVIEQSLSQPPSTPLNPTLFCRSDEMTEGEIIGCGRLQFGVSCRRMVAVRNESTIFKRPRKKKSPPLFFLWFVCGGVLNIVGFICHSVVIKSCGCMQTLAELKEEESLLLKERRNLENELATLRLTVEKQRATNESLKKVKLELQLPQTKMKATTPVLSGEAIWHQHEQINAVGDTTPIMKTSVHCNNVGTSQSSCPSNVSSKVQQEVGSRDTAFSLPDLNLPFGEDPGSEVLYGTS